MNYNIVKQFCAKHGPTIFLTRYEDDPYCILCARDKQDATRTRPRGGPEVRSIFASKSLQTQGG